MDTQIDGSTFTCLNNLFFHLFGDLCHNFFDTSRVDTSVLHELVKGKTRDLSAHRVESRESDCLWGIIHYDFYASSSLKGTDITSFTTNDTSLHLVIINMEYRNSIFYSRLRSNALNRLDNNLLSFFACGEASFVHGVVDIRHGSSLSFITECIYKLLFCFLGRKTRDLLELLLCLLVEALYFLCFVFNSLLLIFKLLTLRIQLVLCTLYLTLLLVELLVTLLLTLFLLVEFLFCLTNLVFVLKFESNKFLFCLDNFVFLDHFGFCLRLS